METLVKRNGLFPTVNTFFDDFISRDLFDWNDKNFTAIGSNLPSVNLKETDDKLQVELAAPGMKKEDFKVEIENNMLMISSERKEEKEETRKKIITFVKNLITNHFAELLLYLNTLMRVKLKLVIKMEFYMWTLPKKKMARKMHTKP